MSLDFYLVARVDGRRVEVFEVNITHNLVPMWKKAGVYDALYESEGKLARDILPLLREARTQMEDHPSEYEELNPENGWGDYEGALEFLCQVIRAAAKFPSTTTTTTTIGVWA
ncbi:MAG: hypothetical protein KGI98_14910 [Euryarchaeota archaeon]|nr:hypothetical protein [Euryarchaeota archaeon]